MSPGKEGPESDFTTNLQDNPPEQAIGIHRYDGRAFLSDSTPELQEPARQEKINKRSEKIVTEVANLPYEALLEEAEKLYRASDQRFAQRRLQEDESLSGYDFPDQNIRLYLRDVTRIPLLGGYRSEFILGRIMEIGKRPENQDQDAHGKRAKEHFILANTRLVFSQAKRFTEFGIFSFLDIVGEGNEGLMKALAHYEWRRGNKFSTYATWWIRQAIVRAFQYEVSYNPSSHQALRELVRYENKLASELGHPPMVEEIAQALFDARYPYGLPKEPQERALARALKKVKRLQALRQYLTRMDIEEIMEGEDDEMTGEERLMKVMEVRFDPTLDQVDADEMLYRFREQIAQAFPDVLNQREQWVLELRYGFNFNFGDGYAHTLEEIGWIMGMRNGRERVRQLEAKALRKLRHPSRVYRYGFREYV